MWLHGYVAMWLRSYVAMRPCGNVALWLCAYRRLEVESNRCFVRASHGLVA